MQWVQVKCEFMAILREGWLQYRKEGRSLVKSWKVAWFELLADGKLTWYPSPSKHPHETRYPCSPPPAPQPLLPEPLVTCCFVSNLCMGHDTVPSSAVSMFGRSLIFGYCVRQYLFCSASFAWSDKLCMTAKDSCLCRASFLALLLLHSR